MKKLVYLLALLATTLANSETLHNYEQVKAAVFEGKYLRLVINYQKCTQTKGQMKVGNNYAVFSPNALAVTTEGSFASYLLYFTLFDPNYLSKPVYQYFRYFINKDNTLQINMSDLSAVDYSPLGFEGSMSCKLDDAVTIFSSKHAFQQPLPNSLPTMTN